MSQDKLKEIVALCKRRGFIFPGSDIYGGLANTWDYGPVGIEMKMNIKNHWWKTFVSKRADMVGVDAAIFMHPKTWEASGHVGGFSDPLIECMECKKRHRGDQLLEDQAGIDAAGMDLQKIDEEIKKHQIKCPDCKASSFTEPKNFNLMFSTEMGVVEGATQTVYLRPETAQGIFVNFNNVLNSYRIKVPFGIAQIGKSFRNEITPKQFIFRTREFEQMEIEYFVQPGSEVEKFDQWVDQCLSWFYELGIKKENLQMREHSKDELAFYSNKTADIEYKFPWGFGELVGIASRTDYDLKQHNQFAEKKLEYLDQETNKRYVPYVIEPSFGVDRSFLTFLMEAYTVEQLDNRTRTVLKLSPKLAPVKMGIFALKRNNSELVELSHKIFDKLGNYWNAQLDNSGNIGKAYSRQDEIGTPYCLTVDFDSLKDQTVTIRDRDTMNQQRVNVDQLVSFFHDKF